jgi:uncharacterized protein
MKLLLTIAFGLSLLFGQACQAEAPFDAQQLAVGQPQAMPLSDLVLNIGPGKRHRFRVQTALTPSQQETGLMWRKSMPADEGMLFVFPEAKQATFWMRNTLISLDLIFIRADGTIANIAARAKPLSLETIPSKGRVIAVLELVGGRAKALGVKPGQRVCHVTLATCANS